MNQSDKKKKQISEENGTLKDKKVKKFGKDESVTEVKWAVKRYLS